MTPGNSLDLDALLKDVRSIAGSASKSIIDIYRSDFSVDYKQDDSPVTTADINSHKIIISGLESLHPRLPVLSEENSDIPFDVRCRWDVYWLVDPLDGTREFINRRDDFSINIALIFGNRPVLGVVHLPVTGSCYAAVSGGNAYRFNGDSRRKLEVRDEVRDEPVVAVSFSHAGGRTGRFLETLGPHKLLRRGSMIKCCLVAEGEVDIYPRLGHTWEWDTAAGQCVVEQAGGRLTDWSGNPLRYNVKDSLLNPFFVAYTPSARNVLDFQPESESELAAGLRRL